MLEGEPGHATHCHQCTPIHSKVEAGNNRLHLIRRNPFWSQVRSGAKAIAVGKEFSWS